MIDIYKDIKLILLHIKKAKVSIFTVTIILFIMLASNFLELLTPLLFGKMMDSVINASMTEIKRYIILMLLFFIISLILNYISSLMIFNMSMSLDINIKYEILNSILNMPHNSYESLNKGTCINNLEHDATIFSSFLTTNLSLFANVLTMIITFLLMSIINPLLTVIVFISFPFSILVHNYIGKKMKSYQIDYKNQYDNYIVFLNETLYGRRSLKLFNVELKRFNNFKILTNNLKEVQMNQYSTKVRGGILLSFSSYLMNIAVVLVGIYLIFNKDFSLGMLVSFNSYAESFKSSSLSLAQLNSIIQEMSVSLSRIQALSCNFNRELVNGYNTSINSINCIDIKKLTYLTLEQKPVMKEINAKFKKNNIYILKGESGSGKTTLLNILCKDINSYSGEVLINNIPIEQINTELLRSKICYITQDSFLYSLSIYENIALYRESSIEQIVEICKRLNIHNSIMALPNQYNSVIGKDGLNLSGGERQRICLARALVQDYGIYLFDEITSAVDSDNVKNIIKIVEDISKDAIVVLATHQELDFLNKQEIYRLPL